MFFGQTVTATFEADPPGERLGDVAPPLDARFRLRRVGAFAVTWRDGTGLPLLFLPENGTTRRIFDFVLCQVPGHPLCAVDHPDSGLDLRARLDDLLALVEAMYWTRFAVIGQGAGADLALQLATHAPDRVAAVLAADPGLGFDTAELHEDWAPDVSAHAPLTLSVRSAALARALADAPDPCLTQPALLVHGANGVAPRAIPGARIMRLSGGYHRLSQDSPAAFAQAIRAFVGGP